MDGIPVFTGLDAEQIAELEQATGLRIADEEHWSPEDYDSVIDFFRRRVGLSLYPRAAPGSSTREDPPPS